MEKILAKLLPMAIYNELICNADLTKLTELRIRSGKPVYYAENGRYKRLEDKYIVGNNDIQYILTMATKSSLYAYNQDMINGFISYDGGIRIGVSGQGITKNNVVNAIKNITSLCIRIPHYIEINNIGINNIIAHYDNTLIVSKPGYGKTTLLRYMIKQLSDNGYNILVLDERGELSSTDNGKSYINLGECSDIVVGIPKTIAYSTQVRSMRPDIVATDEIFGTKEIECIKDCIRCGVKIIATIHASDINDLLNNEYTQLFKMVRYIIVLKGVGNIEKIIDLREYNG